MATIKEVKKELRHRKWAKCPCSCGSPSGIHTKLTLEFMKQHIWSTEYKKTKRF